MARRDYAQDRGNKEMNPIKQTVLTYISRRIDQNIFGRVLQMRR